MITLDTFFKNHFDSDYISDKKMRRFTESHLGLLAANNSDGCYTRLLTDTTEVYNIYFGSMADDDVKFSVQQSLTRSKDSVHDRFRETVSQQEGTIRGKWGVDSSIYEEFFPNGLTEYRKSNLSNVEMLMNRFVTAARAHVDELGKEFVRLFEDLRDEFVEIRQAQVEKMGEVSESRADTAETRDALEAQLMKNVLVIALDNIGHPERVSKFFDESLL